MIFAIYDLEIARAIPPKDKADRLSGIDYCEGWTDFDGMGIACWALCLLDTDTWSISDPIVGTDPEGLWEQKCLWEQMTVDIGGEPINGLMIGGFNSRKFDDRLLQSHGYNLISNFDILDMVLSSAGMTNIAYWGLDPKRSYSLANISTSNGYSKTLGGEQAPIEWQRGNKRLVLDYCANDVRIEAKTLTLLLQGELIDPNTGDKLMYPMPGIAAIV